MSERLFNPPREVAISGKPIDSSKLPKTRRAYFDQGKYWRTADGTWIRVKNMSAAHRANIAAMLIRKAATIVDQIGYAEVMQLAHWSSLGMGEMAYDSVSADIERADAERTADPEKWMRSTKLFRSLSKPRCEHGTKVVKSTPSVFDGADPVRTYADGCQSYGPYAGAFR